MAVLIFGLVVTSPIWGFVLYLAWCSWDVSRKIRNGCCGVCGQPQHFVGYNPTEGMYSSYEAVWSCPNGHVTRTGRRNFAEW